MMRHYTTIIPEKVGPNTLLVGTHEMTRTGAPMIILEIVRHLHARHGAEIVLLCSGEYGPLYEEFRPLCKAIVCDLEKAGKVGPEESIEFFASLAAALPVNRRKALINSFCAGHLMVACDAAGLEVTSLVHEYPYAFDTEKVQTQLQASSNVIFPCRDVYRKFMQEWEPGRDKPHFSIMPQGCYLLDRPPVDEEKAKSEIERIREENHLDSNDRLVFCCGTIDSRKGFDWLISLIIYYMAHSPHAATTHFFWVGSNRYQPELFDHTLHDLRQNGVIGHFHHLDEVEDVRPALGMADVFLLCSRIDPFPSVVLESFAAGVPVVGFDRDQGCADMILDTQFGKIVPYQDRRETTRAIDDLLGDSIERNRVGELGREFVATHFPFKDYADKIAGHLFDGSTLPEAASHCQIFSAESDEEISSPVDRKQSEVCHFSETAEEDRGQMVSQGKVNALSSAVSRGLRYLAANQLPDGEFPTLLSSEPSMEEGAWDSSPFVTALVASSLEASLPESRSLLDRALSFLETQMEPGGVWRYYTKKQFKHDRVPPDLDDTSCAAYVLKRHGRDLPDNRWIFDSLRSPEGGYYTWCLPDSGSREEFVAYLDTLEELAKAEAPEPSPEQARNPRFASPKDPIAPAEVEPVVNANVLLYLGETEQTKPVVDYLVKLASDPAAAEEALVYYTDVVSLSYMMARAGRFSAPSLMAAADDIRNQLEFRFSERDDAKSETVLATALAACSLLYFAPESPAIEVALERLLSSQREDGSWPRSPFYRGPQEFWGSDGLTTAFCLEALQSYADLRGSTTLWKTPTSKTRPMISLDLASESHCFNPFPDFKDLRERDPVAFNQQSQTWLVSGYDDAVSVLNDPETFSNEYSSFEHTLLGANGEAHRRVRSSVKRLFSPAQLRELKGSIEESTRQLLEPLSGRDACEFIEDVARPLPVRVVARLLGVPFELADDFRRWSEAVLYPDDRGREENASLLRECRAFFLQHLEKQRDHPDPAPGTALTALLTPSAEDDVLSDSELVDIQMLVMVAGIATTTNFIANAVAILADDAELCERLRADSDALPNFLEEVLRHQSPIQEVLRLAAADTVLSGCSIAKGERIQVLIGAANRDEAKFPNGEVFDPDRRPNPHIALGRGPHQCLGLLLARLEAEVVVRGWLEKFSHFAACQPPATDLIRTDLPLRGPRSLPLKMRRVEVNAESLTSPSRGDTD
ncbi:MAG: cytochrome P450 [Verrucomicrobiae bacterium]|nr:cytochrome P450 [Verrucomicrobiae bacterium]